MPNPRLAGLSFTTVPVPLSETVCGLPGALSVIDKVAVRGPPCVGLKVTLMVQGVPGATEPLQVLVWWKSAGSAPVKAMLVILSATVP